MNLSKTFTLTGPQEESLSRGLSFVPTPQGGDRSKLMGDIHAFNRRLKLLDYFDYTFKEEYIPFIWEPSLDRMAAPVQKV